MRTLRFIHDVSVSLLYGVLIHVLMICIACFVVIGVIGKVNHGERFSIPCLYLAFLLGGYLLGRDEKPVTFVAPLTAYIALAILPLVFGDDPTVGIHEIGKFVLIATPAVILSFVGARIATNSRSKIQNG